MDPSKEKRQSGISCPLWGTICIGRATPPHPKRTHKVLLQNPGLGPEGGKTHMMRPLERTEIPPTDIGGSPCTGMQHPELSQGVEDAQYPHPCSHSSSCPQSQSLDRHLRSPSRPRLGRGVSFQETEVELDPSERSYRGPQQHSSGIHPEGNDGILPFPQRQETVPPPEMPIVGGRAITHQSFLSGMLRHGWIGKPTSWTCHTGGWRSLPSQMWRTQRD